MNTINTLVYLLPDHEIVSKIIYLMCRNNTVRPELANTCLINHIIEFLKKGYDHYLIQAMCHLLKCPHNRLRFSRLEHGINIFIDLLCNKDPVPKKLALHTLIYFQYSNILLKALIKKNLIPLLIKDLSLYVKSNKVLHVREDESKVQSFNTNSSPSICTSPARTSSMSPITSNKTTYSPLKDDNITTNTNSPDYSPVCESFDTESVNADESKSDISDIIEEEIFVELPNTYVSLTRGGIIIEALTNIIYAQNISELLASKDVWETMFDYIDYIKDEDINTNVVKILDKITCEVQNFKGILIDGFILSVHQRMCRPIHDLDKCKTCVLKNVIGIKIITNASNTFQSKFAEDMMISKMIEPDTSDTNQKLKTLISVTAPLVIQTRPKQLIEMLCRYKVYTNLCNIILDDQNPSFGDAVGAIMSLFKTLKIIYKKPHYERCRSNQKCRNRVFPKKTTVTLVMDDGTLINANKSFLSLKSPMFEAMFRCGGFKEAYENTIRLNDITSECFNCLLRLLDDYCECKLPTNINVFLELIIITDKYMLNELFDRIYPAFMKYMSVENCSIIYEWVKKTGFRLQINPSADFEVIKYLLHSNSKFSDRVKAIQDITRNDYGQHFIDDLSIILKPGLECSIYGDHNATSSLFYLSHFPNALETLKMT
ncbi:Hypothetical protein CINCED_3A016625 [Cinara cedri]|nr:Hypothetical protein CINCED_3A016625 [Cinara cedri]